MTRTVRRPVLVPSIALSVALSVALATSGCSGDDDPVDQRDDVADRTASVQAAAQTLIPAVGDGVGVLSYSSSGQARWQICGMPPSPSGAEYVAEVSITATESVPSSYADSIVAAVESQGWTIDSSTADVIVAVNDDLELTARYQGGVINLMISAPCLDVSGDDAERLADLPADDLALTATP